MAEDRVALPPLRALRAFEAASRCGSLSAAARELGVTQPAISRQIDALESWFGLALFDRHSRGLDLTEAGAVLHGAVEMAFGELAGAVARLRPAGSAHAVTILAHPGFAQLWLAPRLAGLQASLPNAFFRLVSTDREDEFAAGAYDLAIRFGTGAWAGWQTVPLLPERIVPVCAPAYRDRRPALARPGLTPAALAGETLLHMDEVSTRWLTWPAWFAAHGVPAVLARPRVLQASYPLLLQAALAGEGVALGWLGLVDEALAAGTLVRLLAPLDRPERGYFLCWRDGKRQPPGRRQIVDRIRDWFLAAARPAG